MLLFFNKKINIVNILYEFLKNISNNSFNLYIKCDRIKINKLIGGKMKEKIHEILSYNYKLYRDEKISEDLAKFVDMMLKYNEIHNLTAITEPDEVVFKHLLDSVLPVQIIWQNKKVLDIGCGAGFPSVPLAIVNRNLDITAVDSVQKKTDFVQMVKDELKLDNLTVKHCRIEDLARSEERETYDIVVSRAVAPLNVIIEYSAPMLKNGGHIYAYKGVNYDQEIKVGKRAMRLLDCSVAGVNEYYVEELDTSRYVIRIRKNSTIIPKYPRKQNKPRLQPL